MQLFNFEMLFVPRSLCFISVYDVFLADRVIVHTQQAPATHVSIPQIKKICIMTYT
jgi:hypothetical protein